MSLFAFLLLTLTALAQTADKPAKTDDGTANPVVLIVVMGFLALAPFALIMLTSFVKISVVLSILRNALGTQQIPPNQVITGLSLILTIFIMTPVAEKMYAQAGDVGKTDAIFSELSVREVFEASKRGREPLRQFLERYAHKEDLGLFFDWARKIAQRNGNNPDGCRCSSAASGANSPSPLRGRASPHAIIRGFSISNSESFSCLS